MGFFQNLGLGLTVGDFAENTGWGGVTGQVVGGLIPVYGQFADARDTLAAIMKVWDEPSSGEAWLGLAMAGVAWIPVAGDAAKGGYRVTRNAVEEVGETVVKSADNVTSVSQKAYKGQTVYRVWGGDALPAGHSWTPVNPSTLSSYRSVAGLPDANSGRFVSEAIIQDIFDIQVRSALPFNGNPGGLTEYIIPNPNSQLRIIRISGANPEF